MMMGKLFRGMGPFWDIFLTKWDPVLKIDVTVLKLAPIVNWFLADDLPQGTIFTKQSGPRYVADFCLEKCTHCQLVFGRQFAPRH